jgi:RNA-directed DNA polymerase
VIRENKQVTTGNLIAQLNPKIRGWANYHRHVVSKETFSKVDHAIFCALWQWAKRRHPKKPIRWIRKKYFTSIEGQHWVFHGEILGQKGAFQPIRLFKAKSVAIERHTKIQSEANPYDPKWETYFEKRLDVKTVHNLKGKRHLIHHWKQLGIEGQSDPSANVECCSIASYNKTSPILFILHLWLTYEAIEEQNR